MSELNQPCPSRHASLVAGIFLLFSLSASADNALEGTVVAEGVGFGNLETDIPISSSGLTGGRHFTIRCRDRSFPAVLVSWYSDVPEGNWLGIENEAGNLQLAINNGDANVESGCGEGDPVLISFDIEPAHQPG